MHRRMDQKTLTESPKGVVHVFLRPDQGEKEVLLRWGIDPHTLKSALDPGEVPRLEFEKGHCALIFKGPRPWTGGTQEPRVGSLGLFLFKDKLVAVTSEDEPFREVAGHLDGTLVGVILKVLDRTLWHFLEHMNLITQASDRLQGKLATAMENRHLLSLFELQKGLVYYESAINANSGVLEILQRHADRIGFNRTQRDLLGDILVESRQCDRQVEDLTNVLSNLMDARASIVNNNLNILIKFLNLVTLAVMVPTLVVSVFSMNVRLPGQEHPRAFLWILVLALSATGVFLAYWRGRKW